VRVVVVGGEIEDVGGTGELGVSPFEAREDVPSTATGGGTAFDFLEVLDFVALVDVSPAVLDRFFFLCFFPACSSCFSCSCSSSPPDIASSELSEESVLDPSSSSSKRYLASAKSTGFGGHASLISFSA